jgi:hypothetical protein
MDHPHPWLRIVDADALEDSAVDFGKLAVKSPTGDKLGKVDGFIVDVDSGRPYYVVVDASGWFKTRHFLLPIGHAQLDSDSQAILADVSRDRVKNFPGFDKSEFAALGEDDLARLGDETSQACCVTDVTIAVWERPHYEQPAWWRDSYVGRDRSTLK